MICPTCQAWIEPILDPVAGTFRCPDCGYTKPRRFSPLFIVTGPSGAGKTAVVPELQRLLPHWEVFETDILWDSGHDWGMVKANWLRIADSLSQRPHGRLTILCGTVQPEDILDSGMASRFSAVYWLALVCDPEVLEKRLRARPAWRGCDEAFIAGQLDYLRWLKDNARMAFKSPLTLLDTTAVPVSQTAQEIARWAESGAAPISSRSQRSRLPDR